MKTLLSEGPFAILFIWLLITSRKDSKEREDKLMVHVEKMEEQFEKHTTTLGQIERRMSHIEVSVQQKLKGV